MPRAGRYRGFTLAELIVMLVVMGIVTTFAVGKFADQTSFDVPGFAERLRSTVRFAQKVAIAQNRAVYISIQSGRLAACFDAGCTSQVSAAGSNSGSAETLAACGNATWACEGSPSGVSLSSTSALFYFDALGRPFGGSDSYNGASTFTTHTITVSGSGLSSAVTVEADTGYVH